MADTLRKLNQKDQKFLAGQAFHMELMTLMVLWTLGGMVERDQGEVPRQVHPSSSSLEAPDLVDLDDGAPDLLDDEAPAAKCPKMNAK